MRELNTKYVSVIVPIYNSDMYLHRCLDSIINQTYRNLQIILVDDGSEDKSSKICEQYAQKDDRIEVYHVENRGVSNTRNYALTKVRGEYVQFVDSDDILKNNMTEIMVKAIEKSNADMVVCNYIKDFEIIHLSNSRLEFPGTYTNEKYLRNTLRDPGHHYYGVVWNKLYRSRIIAENEIRFDVSVDLGEDFIFNLGYWQNCGKIKVCRKNLYYYNKARTVTLSSNRNKTIDDCKKELYNRKKIFNIYMNVFKKLGMYEKYKDRIYFYWVIFFARQWNSLKCEYKNWSESQIKEWRDIILKDKNIQKSFQLISKIKIVMYAEKNLIGHKVKNVIKNLIFYRKIE